MLFCFWLCSAIITGSISASALYIYLWVSIFVDDVSSLAGRLAHQELPGIIFAFHQLSLKWNGISKKKLLGLKVVLPKCFIWKGKLYKRDTPAKHGMMILMIILTEAVNISIYHFRRSPSLIKWCFFSFNWRSEARIQFYILAHIIVKAQCIDFNCVNFIYKACIMPIWCRPRRCSMTLLWFSLLSLTLSSLLLLHYFHYIGTTAFTRAHGTRFIFQIMPTIKAALVLAFRNQLSALSIKYCLYFDEYVQQQDVHAANINRHTIYW